jgi:CBS domain-containing protein
MAQVAELMRRDFILLDDAELQREAAQVMRMARLRHLPVARGGRLVGVISNRDLLEDTVAALEQAVPPTHLRKLRDRPLEHLVNGDLIAIGPECTLARAAELMLDYKVGFLPVVDSADGRLLGIVTESDLLRAAYVSNG